MTVTHKKFVSFITIAGLYFCMVNVNIRHRARLIEEERRLATWVEADEKCYLTPAAKIVPGPETKKTLLTSYPGSGKRFTLNVIEALTDHSAGDDHNFSGNGEGVLHLKTGFPHRDGVWSWGDAMDQVILLVRNPRWALPAYHNLRFELDFSENWSESYTRLPFVMTQRPDVGTWREWRDAHFEEEMKAWEEHIAFWMEGGLLWNGDISPHCDADIDCYPKTVVDFDRFFQENPAKEYFKIGALLDVPESNIEVINKKARACIFDAVFIDKTKHHGNRSQSDGASPAYKQFTAPQLNSMVNTLEGMKAKYSTGTYAEDPVAQDLVKILNEYIDQDFAEFQYEDEATA